MAHIEVAAPQRGRNHRNLVKRNVPGQIHQVPGLRERKKARLRQQIIETAIRLFRKQGYEKTRVDDIVKILEISQPRAPCFKLAIHTARPDAPQLMTLSGRCGWYFRVAQEGDAPVLGGSLVRVFESGGPSVREAFSAVFDPHAGTSRLQRVEAAAGLAESWRNPVSRRLSKASDSI